MADPEISRWVHGWAKYGNCLKAPSGVQGLKPLKLSTEF